MSNYLDNIDFIDSSQNTTNVLIQDKETLSKLNSFMSSQKDIVLNVKDYGATGNGTTDDYAAIMAALNALPASGGTIYFPAGNYAISQGIDIGDGQAATVADGNKSSKQNIKLIGVGCIRASTPNVTQITPLKKIGYIFNVKGLIDNVRIEGFNLFVNGLADYGMFICATNGSTFKDITIYNPTYCGIQVVGGHTPTGNYNTACLYDNVSVTLNTNGTIGLQMTGDILANNDTWLTTFINCRFQSMASTSNCTSAIFRFCDNITFIRCHFVTYSSTGRGIDLNALDTIANNPFPSGLSFIDCSIANTSITEDVANGKLIGVNRFYGYGIDDGEVLPPRDPRLVGFDAKGVPFGGFAQKTLTSVADILALMQSMPNLTSMPITANSTLTNNLFGTTTTSSGIITQIDDTIVELTLMNNVGIFYCRVNNSGQVYEKKKMAWTAI